MCDHNWGHGWQVGLQLERVPQWGTELVTFWFADEDQHTELHQSWKKPLFYIGIKATCIQGFQAFYGNGTYENDAHHQLHFLLQIEDRLPTIISARAQEAATDG